MNLGPYRLVSQFGAGRDGVCYQAQTADGKSVVEVRSLGPARADADRWPGLSRRLQVAALLDHPGAVRVRELGLKHAPPFVALEWIDPADWRRLEREPLPLAAVEAAGRACHLAGTLAAAHRLGLAQGNLGPGAVAVTGAGTVKIDFTGTDVFSPADESSLAAIAAACRAPELTGGTAADSAADVYSLGVLLYWWLTGQAAGENGPWPEAPDLAGELFRIIRAMLHPDPVKRLWAKKVEDQLAALRVPKQVLAPSEEEFQQARSLAVPPTLDDDSPRRQRGRERLLEHLGQRLPPTPTHEHLGRFRLLEKLGQGGMGTVYRAADISDGTVVAVKVIRPDLVGEPEALQRFHKEARLLAEVNNPYVTELFEVNEDHGVHYLVLEFVAGPSLGDLIDERGRLDEPTALALVADAARGLAEAHERGIVHRDVKPDNLLLVRGPWSVVRGQTASPSDPAESVAAKSQDATDHGPPTTDKPRVKVSDFGLARHVNQTDSLRMTKEGAVIGTPLYMAPEQCQGNTQVDARADVYALGATLFHVLAGRPPFEAERSLDLIAKHCQEPPPPLSRFNPDVSEGACRLVEKCLAKLPEARYLDAGELLRDLERLLRGEPTSISVHPRLPVCDPRNVIKYVWTWELEATPRQLWPFIANTDRLNRAIGLPPVQFTDQADGQGVVRRQGQLRKLGMTAAWHEHPFEWIEGRRMGALREYQKGPFKWLLAILEMVPRAGGGTTLTNTVHIEPNGLLGRTVAAVEVKLRGRLALGRVFRRLDAALTGKLEGSPAQDPFEAPVALPGAKRRRLAHLLERLEDRGVDPEVCDWLGDFLTNASAQEVARMRPLALAQHFGLDADKVVTAFLQAAREGLLVLLWDILCPVCRIPSEIRDTLRALEAHGRCVACNLDFELDFAHSVELVFRAHPEIRPSELATYCVGGPAQSPHVVAQVRVASGERLELDLELGEGMYRLRGPQLAFALTFRVGPGAATARWDISLSRGLDPDLPRSLRPGRQLLALVNDSTQELLVRLERAAPRADALTAARAAALALFRELFPREILAPGQLVSVAAVTLLLAQVDGADALYGELGDLRAAGLLYDHFRRLEERVRGDGGAVVKTVGEGVLAVFTEPVAAVRVALDLPALLPPGEAGQALRPQAAVHRGAAVVATVGDHLDYLGGTVTQALQWVAQAQSGELVLSPVVAADPQVAALLAKRGLQGAVLSPDASGPGQGPALRVSLPDSDFLPPQRGAR